MKYIVNLDNAPEFLNQANKKLEEVEVRGSSVESLYLARMLLIKIINSLEVLNDEKGEKGEQ